MGSGASSTSAASTPEPTPPKIAELRPIAATKPLDMDSTQRHLVRTNQVAPIIIKNCKEEYQHVTDFKEPLVYGCIAENMPEHALVKNQYFLVKDVNGTMDHLGTSGQYLAPNVRRCRGQYPVYGMGQPTKDGLDTIIRGLREEGHRDVMLFNVRQEAVVFARDGFDMIPYSLHHQDALHECACAPGSTLQQTQDTEIDTRKEVIDLAALKEDSHFYFYSDIGGLPEDLHMLRMAYEDDLAVTDEIYCRLSFNNSGIRYTRLPLPPEGAPAEADFDALINTFRSVPEYLNSDQCEAPAIVVTSREGVGRASLGMVMSCLILAHKHGFPKEARKSPYAINDKSPNLERGEFDVIIRLVRYLEDGPQLKHQVDVLVDLCDELHNLRCAAAETKKNLDSITEDYIIEGQSAKRYLLQLCRSHLERYFYLICFNAYLKEHFNQGFSLTFSRWMQNQPELYHMLETLDVSERTTSPSLISRQLRHLVADDYIGLDVLSSQMDVNTSNFRHVPGLPVYGMAQPSREGLACVVSHLLSKKQGHPLVVIFNLRNDLVVECNGATYSVRENTSLEQPLIMAGISAPEIQEKEEQMKSEIKSVKSFQVYEEITLPPVEREFNSVLTPSDLVEQLQLQTTHLAYHRVPMSDDKAPTEKDFDTLLTLIHQLDEVHTDEDGPALVFHCRTGKGRTTTAMTIAGLILCHKKGFPYGTKPGEEERVSLPNASYTKGNFKVVQELVRRIPNGQQVKREVDFILDQCSDTMTPMHYHIREVIFVTYNKIKKAKTAEELSACKRMSLDFLERYMYLILFNAYLHCERRTHWKRSFSTWMKQVAAQAGVYELLDNLSFSDFSDKPSELRTRRARWNRTASNLPIRGSFV